MNVNTAIEEWPHLSFGRKKEILTKIIDCYLQVEAESEEAREEINIILDNAQYLEQDDFFGTEGLRV